MRARIQADQELLKHIGSNDPVCSGREAPVRNLEHAILQPKILDLDGLRNGDQRIRGRLLSQAVDLRSSQRLQSEISHSFAREKNAIGPGIQNETERFSMINAGFEQNTAGLAVGRYEGFQRKLVVAIGAIQCRQLACAKPLLHLDPCHYVVTVSLVFPRGERKKVLKQHLPRFPIRHIVCVSEDDLGVAPIELIGRRDLFVSSLSMKAQLIHSPQSEVRPSRTRGKNQGSPIGFLGLVESGLPKKDVALKAQELGIGRTSNNRGMNEPTCVLDLSRPHQSVYGLNHACRKVRSSAGFRRSRRNGWHKQE